MDDVVGTRSEHCVVFLDRRKELLRAFCVGTEQHDALPRGRRQRGIGAHRLGSDGLRKGGRLSGEGSFEGNTVRLDVRGRSLSEENKNLTGDIVRRGCSTHRSDTKNEEQQAEKGNSDLLHGTSPLSSVFWKKSVVFPEKDQGVEINFCSRFGVTDSMSRSCSRRDRNFSSIL